MAITECLKKNGEERIDNYPKYSCCYRSVAQRVSELKMVYSTQITFYYYYYLLIT